MGVKFNYVNTMGCSNKRLDLRFEDDGDGFHNVGCYEVHSEKSDSADENLRKSHFLVSKKLTTLSYLVKVRAVMLPEKCEDRDFALGIMFLMVIMII